MDDDAADDDSRYLTRRRVLAGAGGLLGADMAGSFLLDSYVHGKMQVLDPEAVCDVTYPPAIQAAADDDLTVHLVNVAGPSGDTQYDVDTGSTAVDHQLGDLEIDADVQGYDVPVPDDIYAEITETGVKAAKQSGVIDTVATYLADETAVLDAVQDEDIAVFISDFDTDMLSYRGTAYDGQYAAVTSAYSQEYTTNQILHNTGHTLGLPHTYTEDQMTWSLLTELVSHKNVIGFGFESWLNWKDAQERYRDGRNC